MRAGIYRMLRQGATYRVDPASPMLIRLASDLAVSLPRPPKVQGTVGDAHVVDGLHHIYLPTHGPVTVHALPAGFLRTLAGEKPERWPYALPSCEAGFEYNAIQ